MLIELKPDQAIDDATKLTGKSLPQWFAEIDSWGGAALGRREISSRLYDEHKVDPWWAATLNIEYEAARGIKEKDGRAKGYMICATKTIKATADTCYDAFVSAAALDRWLGPAHALTFSDGGSLSNGDGNRALIRKINPAKTIKLVWQQADAALEAPHRLGGRLVEGLARRERRIEVALDGETLLQLGDGRPARALGEPGGGGQRAPAALMGDAAIGFQRPLGGRDRLRRIGRLRIGGDRRHARWRRRSLRPGPLRHRRGLLLALGGAGRRRNGGKGRCQRRRRIGRGGGRCGRSLLGLGLCLRHRLGHGERCRGAEQRGANEPGSERRDHDRGECFLLVEAL